MRDYRKIKAWQTADELAVKIYETTRQFPKEEMYGLTSQMRRAAVSAAANIAEGSARAHQKEYLQFLFIAKSSARELEYYIHLSNKLGYFKETEFKELEKMSTESIHILFGLIRAVSNQN